MFRNFSIFTLDPERCYALIATLESDLAEKPFVECPTQAMGSSGFVPPVPGSAELAPVINDKTVIAMLTESKILPGAAVQNELRKRLDVITEREGRRTSGRERKRIKEEVIADLLARALTKRALTTAYIDPSAGILVIDTAAPRAAEEFISDVRRVAGSLGATPIHVNGAVRAGLTSWIAGTATNMPKDWHLSDSCVLRDPATGGRWAGRGLDLDGNDVKEALRGGMTAQRVAFEIDSDCVFTLDDVLTVRRFALLDGALDRMPADGYEDAAAEYAGRFTIASSVIDRVIRGIDSAFGIARGW